MPDLPDCFARGSSSVDAVVGVEAAMEAWLAAARQSDMPIPQPGYDWKNAPLI